LANFSRRSLAEAGYVVARQLRIDRTIFASIKPFSIAASAARVDTYLSNHVCLGAVAMATQRAFPLNAWYAVAWDAELRHELCPRTVANKKIVLYRRSDGRPVALEDACWHRLLPLSGGG
jgi:hypothetical protein